MKRHFLLYIFLIVISGKIHAQLFEQDFSGSSTLANYISATPSNGQFNAISTSGAGATVSINTTGGNKLRFARTGNAASYSRTSDFSPLPTTLLYQFDITVSGTTTAATTGGVWQIGSGFATANTAEAIANVHSRIALNLTNVTGEFQLRNIGSATNTATFTGTQTIRWYVNNSGSSITYQAPNGSNETLSNDAADVWIGTTKVFDELAATTATQTLADIKFVWTNGNGIIDFDNFLIAPIPSVPASAAGSNITSTSFTANWATVADATGYRIDIATDAGFTNILAGYNNLYVAGQATNSLSVTGLSANTQYFYRVRAASQFAVGEVASGNSSAQNLTTLAANPAITITGTPLIPFTAFTGCHSASQSYNVEGIDLTDDITINAPANFEISTDDIVWQSSIDLFQSSGTVAPTVIYVRYNPAASGTHIGDITHVSTGATQQDVAVSGSTNESVVVNKYNVTTDEVELLVVENNLILQGFIIKDFSNNMNDDNGGAYEFTGNALWNSIQPGTLIILRNNNTANDINPADYTLDIGLQNTTYFASLGGTWDLENTDMVMVKDSGTGASGITGNIHLLAAGTAGVFFTNASDPKLISTSAASVTDPFVYAINSNSEICDFIGNDAGTVSGLTFGASNNTTNMVFICSLRTIPQPTITVNGSTTICAGDSVILDAGAGFASYTWSNTETTQTITVTSSGTFTVTIADAAGCTAVSTNSIVVDVNNLPNVTLSSFSAVCNNDPGFPLTGGSPSGGSYSGPGVSGGNFNPAIAGVGTHSIIYSFTDTNGCANSDTATITVNSCSTVPTIQLQAPYCPYTMSAILDYVYAQQVPGATNYQYYVEEVGVPTLFTATYNRNSGSNILSLMWIKGIKFNTTYAVQVRAFVGGQWGVFGPACNVTTPSNLPTPAINPNYCNITMTTINDLIFVDPVWQAINYNYEITNVSTSAVMNYHRGSGSNAFSLGWVKGILYNTTYSVRVRANINGDWTNFSAPCTITTPPMSAAQLQAQYCNVTLPAINTTMSAVAVPHATNYRYTITDSLGFSVVYHRGSSSPLVNLSWIAGIQPNTTYYIGVQAMQGATVGPMGTICTVITPSMLKLNSSPDVAGIINYSLYPNPNSGDKFIIDLGNIEETTLIKVDIYDLNGKLMWNKHFTTSTSLVEVELENALSHGIYTISVLNNEQVQFRKLIIQK